MPANEQSWDEPVPGTFEHDLASRLLEQRVLTMSGRLDEAAANRVTSQLILLGRSSTREPITLHLSAGESELGASLALADAVELARDPVHAVVHGILRGPAVAVLCAATTRAAHRHALLALSVPSVSGRGTAAQLAGLAEVHERQVEQLTRRIIDATGQLAEIVEADLEYGRLLSAEEARDYGLVQEIL
jgi:ATP-dependent Clp protease protease subunit